MNNSFDTPIYSIYFQLIIEHINISIKHKYKVIYYLIAKLQLINNEKQYSFN